VEDVAMRIIVLPVIAAGLVAGSIPLAGTASAYCDSASCVPNVTRNVVANGPCTPSKYFAFGLDASGATFVCNVAGVWEPVGPLVGMYNVTMPCPGMANASAQGSDGVPFQCVDMGGPAFEWAHRPDTVG
jgi:hypothetical protein